MQVSPYQAIKKQRRMARTFLILVCALYVLLLCVLSFFPELLQTPFFGASMTLGILVAFLSGVFVFIVMLYYVRMYKAG